ncbi:retrovirus-related Pol polyprotein from transposon 412 [Trichonephila clavipes]|nr:retrovirus-related Pol polyprotein from transposon 412 [Trichonephila clavipes]
MVSKNQQDWDQKVPLFLLAYRSAVHETTGYSPSQMLFGRDLRLPCDLLFGRPPDTPSSPEEYVQNLQARFEDVHNLARERINLRTEKMKTRYDTKATGHQFKEGDKVWFYNPTRRKGLSPKLQSHWDGPYTILKIINDVVIRIHLYTVQARSTIECPVYQERSKHVIQRKDLNGLVGRGRLAGLEDREQPLSIRGPQSGGPRTTSGLQENFAGTQKNVEYTYPSR